MSIIQFYFVIFKFVLHCKAPENLEFVEGYSQLFRQVNEVT